MHLVGTIPLICGTLFILFISRCDNFYVSPESGNVAVLVYMESVDGARRAQEPIHVGEF